MHRIMKVIILAGGKGTRLTAKNPEIPKALVQIGGKPLIWHQIDLLTRHGCTDIRFALGFQAEQIISYLEDAYEYVIEEEPLGTGGAVKFASRDQTEPFLVLNGDIISDANFTKLLQAIERSQNYMLVAYKKANTDFGLIKIDDSGTIIEFTEKPAIPTNGYVNVGVYLLQPEVCAAMPKRQFSLEYDVFPTLAQSRKLKSLKHDGFWLDVGTPERYSHAQSLFA
jgi:NDP-sugar pyrophosphorylase family protein